MTKLPNGSLAPGSVTLLDYLQAQPELCVLPKIDYMQLDPVMDSSDMTPEVWIELADIIARCPGYNGYVIAMGTDTMAYAASALAFLLAGLGSPVILTGAMLPLSDVQSDARRHLFTALMLAAQLDLPEVALLFHSSLLRGCRAVKLDSRGLAAFESPGMRALATINGQARLRRHLWRDAPAPGTSLQVQHTWCPHLAVWRMVPGYADTYIEHVIERGCKLRAIVVELYGTGNLSSTKTSLLQALKLAYDRGIVVAAVSQCLYGGVRLSAYAVGAKLLSCGVLDCADMTAEAVTTKLGYLLGQPGSTAESVRAAMVENLRGEITPTDSAHSWLELSKL